ncbi:transglycosylase SLT domain-containing protein [Rhodanobacter sp. L36]|uniref:transglycosylase SLT domain-containing protein n=1 Tax=Rhodanobacter sp. L36 TaxID=1747221 RepID=UPI00131E83D0|nr:transglycosylase SLT domain-containing protein [Rhodanobacter sp. L36]
MFFLLPSRRIARVGWLSIACGWLIATTAGAAEPSDAQRDAFRQAYVVAQQGGDAWRGMSNGLHDYPLYPYLEAAALEHDIHQTDRAAVESYLHRYTDMIPAADLRRDFLLELARREDWPNFLALYQPGIGDALSCDALQARLARGEKLNFDKDLDALWSKPTLPGACDAALDAAHDQALLTTSRLWSRIDRAADAGKADTIASTADWLQGDDASTAQRLAQALRDPSSAVAAADAWANTPHNTQAVTLAIARLARRQSGSADSAWQNLQTRFAFSEQQRDKILYALALFHATDFDDQALERLIALPAAAQTDASREWRVRVALSKQKWPAVLAAIQSMPATQQQDGEWRYFLARALTELGRGDESKQVLQSLAGEATFFGFLAADRLGTPYAICPAQLAGDPQQEQALLNEPGLVRAFELYAVGLPKLARREWTRALDGADAPTLRLAADLANRRGWYDRAVFTLSSGDALRLYELRFPLASQDGVVPQAIEAGIEPVWAYGILRAESAWMTDARSGADARGLMQLVPATAALVARRNGLDWGGGDTLYDPSTNIKLGTRYLAQMAERYNGSPWLASAAYNAGPNRVDQWLAARGTLSPELFVATIPFKETREYVARVMAFSVIYDWRLNGKATPLSRRMSAIGQAYALPAANDLRRSIECPAVAPAPSSSASSHAPATASTTLDTTP